MLDADLLQPLTTPCVVLDHDRVRRNVEAMAADAAASGVRLRPHIKAHKTVEIARLQLEAGAEGLTCATPREVEVMLATGAEALTLAYPVVTPALARRLRDWRERVHVRVHLDSVESARVVGDDAGTEPVEVLVEVDTGHHRLGRRPGTPTLELAREIDAVAGVRVVGLASHAGHAYQAGSRAEQRSVATAEAADLRGTADLLRADGIAAEVLSVGSTPSTRAGLGTGITESRPGTYALNDTTMVRLGAADVEQCAALVLATVVGRPDPRRVVLDAGSKVLSTDWVGTPDWVLAPAWPGLHPRFLSEEHGVFDVDEGAAAPGIGDRLLLVPAHVCTVMNLAERVHVVSGGVLAGDLEVAARGRVPAGS